jgi:hypothetical protein
MCNFSENNAASGITYDALNGFDLSDSEGMLGFECTITCGNCGHTDQVGRFTFASKIQSPTVHLGISHINNTFISRCGLLSGSESQRTIKFHDSDKFNAGLYKPCKSCEKFEGFSDKDRKLATREDEVVIESFYDICEKYRDQASQNS